MAKSRFSIIFNYRMAMKQADALDEISNELNLSKNLLDNCQSELLNCWKSDNSNRFISKLSITKDNIFLIKKQLNDTASVIRNIAKRNYNAEMTALEISQRRTYK